MKIKKPIAKLHKEENHIGIKQVRKSTSKTKKNGSNKKQAVRQLRIGF